MVHVATAVFALGLDTVATHVCSFETETRGHGCKTSYQDSEKNKVNKVKLFLMKNFSYGHYFKI